MYVGAVVHRVGTDGSCLAATITDVVRDPDTGENVNGKVLFGNVPGHPTGELSPDTYFEGTWHEAASCKRDETRVGKTIKPPKK